VRPSSRPNARRLVLKLGHASQALPVVHAIHILGLPSETFIRDSITEAEALGWRPWLVTEAIAAASDAKTVARTVVAPQRLPLVDRIAIRTGSDNVRARAARKYLTAVSRVPPGILHAHFGWTAVDCTVAAETLGLPFLASFHGTDLTVDAEDAAWSSHYQAMLRRVDAVTVVSRFLETRLRSLGYEGDVALVPSGVRLMEFPFSGGPRHGAAPRLLMVGRLVACKGFDVGLEALAIARARGVSATLRVVGDGILREELEATARSLGVGRAVEFLGARQHYEVRRELEQADIVVVPSRRLANGQEEGSSVVSKEAQAIGVPVIGSKVGGIPETLPPDLRFELVPPDQPELLANQLIEVWAQRNEWPARLRMQREWIASEFAWGDIARRLSALYSRLAEEHPPRRAVLARVTRLSRRRLCE
jgi:colanic acid/amylovoran biosynthesis glycosyltransferase